MTVRGVRIKIQDLTHRYSAKSPITFDKVNLEAEQGEAPATRIEDARETLSYDQLMAMILVIGAIGYLLDSFLVLLIKRYSWHRQA